MTSPISSGTSATADRLEVIVIGGGQSGLAIGYFLAQQGRKFVILEAANEPAAAWRELSRTHEVHLSIGSRQTPLPQPIFGRDLFWYLEATGLIRKSTETRIGRRLAGRDTLIGSRPRSLRRRHGVHLYKRAVGRGTRGAIREWRGARNQHRDLGDRVQVHDCSWIKVPVFDEHGRAVHRRGVTEAPGLYFLGLTWQYTRGSALLGWVSEDASYIAERIEAFRATATPSERREPVRAQ